MAQITERNLTLNDYVTGLLNSRLNFLNEQIKDYERHVNTNQDILNRSKETLALLRSQRKNLLEELA